MVQPPVILQDILTILNQFAPFMLAEPWDNVGLMVGSPEQKISGILLGLDPTQDLIQEACSHGANLVINHHPLIFEPLRGIRVDQPIGSCIAEAVKNGVAIIGCHTNLDVVQNGVSHVLAEQIGLQNCIPLRQRSASEPHLGFGAVGDLASALPPDEFLGHLCHVLELDALKICGPMPSNIQKIAVCGGSGSDLAEEALSAGAQLYITGEVKHSVARWAEESGLCIIDAGHFATENLVIGVLATTLRNILAERDIKFSVTTSKSQKNPFFYYMKSK